MYITHHTTILPHTHTFPQSYKQVESLNEIHIRDGLFTVFTPGKAVAELRVGELMQPSSGSHTEVTPHVLIAAEVQLLHRARARFKTLRQINS